MPLSCSIYSRTNKHMTLGFIVRLFASMSVEKEPFIPAVNHGRKKNTFYTWESNKRRQHQTPSWRLSRLSHVILFARVEHFQRAHQMRRLLVFQFLLLLLFHVYWRLLTKYLIPTSELFLRDICY